MKSLASTVLALVMLTTTAQASKMMGAHENEETRPVTPITIGKEGKADQLLDQLNAMSRDHAAQTANLRMHSSLLSEHRNDLADVEKKIAKGGAGTDDVPAKLFVARDSARSNVKDFDKATSEARNILDATEKKLETLTSELYREWGKSLGWYVSESPEEKKLSAESGFTCGEGERQVAQLGIGMYTWGCLNSKGYMTKRGQRVIGMPEYYRDTKFVRDGDSLQQVIVTDAEGQIVSEKTVGAKEETTKTFNKGTLASSCTSFGDAKTRAASGVCFSMGMSFGVGMGHGMGMGAYGYGAVVSGSGMGGGIGGTGAPASQGQSGAPILTKPTAR